jgi:hypothetical protein
VNLVAGKDFLNYITSSTVQAQVANYLAKRMGTLNTRSN